MVKVKFFGGWEGGGGVNNAYCGLCEYGEFKLDK